MQPPPSSSPQPLQTSLLVRMLEASSAWVATPLMLVLQLLLLLLLLLVRLLVGDALPLAHPRVGADAVVVVDTATCRATGYFNVPLTATVAQAQPYSAGS
jgi:uncharacterized membrane protein